MKKSDTHLHGLLRAIHSVRKENKAMNAKEESEVFADEFELLLRANEKCKKAKVLAERGHLVIYVSAESCQGGFKLARLTPLDHCEYGLSFCNHSGKWEKMPFKGKLSDLAKIVPDVLGHFFQDL